MKKLQVSKNNALLVAGILFGIVAILHLLRLVTGFNLLIARHLIPVEASFPAFFIFLGLAIWMFMARVSKRSS